MKQEDVAFDIDISITAYAKIERGETNIPFLRLVQIANYLKVEIAELVSDNNICRFENLASDIREIKSDIRVIKEELHPVKS